MISDIYIKITLIYKNKWSEGGDIMISWRILSQITLESLRYNTSAI